MASMKYFGKEYPLEYTVYAQSVLAGKFGGVDNIPKAFETEDLQAMMENVTFCAVTMANASQNRERLMSKEAGEEFQLREIPTQEDLKMVLHPVEVVELSKEVISAMKEGNTPTVEVEPAQGKNAEATP